MKLANRLSVFFFVAIVITFLVAISYGGSEEKDFNNVNWKAVLMAGDDRIQAFDNARNTIRKIFMDYGVKKKNIIELSLSKKYQEKGVRATSIANFEQAMSDLNVGSKDGCVVYMTSHGYKYGYYIHKQGFLTPEKLNHIITKSCGNRPTVIIISACFSGVFAEPDMQKNNRVILTAARKDRPSFGCGVEDIYTYWDGCFIDNIKTSLTWKELAVKIKQCVRKKEKAIKVKKQSYPQSRFGSYVYSLPIFKLVYQLEERKEIESNAINGNSYSIRK